PLRSVAIADAAALADRVGDRARLSELVALGRREVADAAGPARLDDETATRLELLAFANARQEGNREAAREAARRLLIRSPIEAATVLAAEVFRAPNGSLDWSSFLSQDEIQARAGRLI